MLTALWYLVVVRRDQPNGCLVLRRKSSVLERLQTLHFVPRLRLSPSSNLSTRFNHFPADAMAFTIEIIISLLLVVLFGCRTANGFQSLSQSPGREASIHQEGQAPHLTEKRLFPRSLTAPIKSIFPLLTFKHPV